MTISGTIIVAMPLESGQGRNGYWQKKGYVIQTPGEYPKKVAFYLWGDNADLVFNVGQDVTVSINIESREYNERWYTEIRAWKVVVDSGEESQAPPPPPEQEMPLKDDDLPF